MAASSTAKRKASETEPSDGNVCTKVTRTIHNNDKSNSTVVPGADPLARVAATGESSASAGRGSLSGWTLCPLCGIYSKKKHALGRGIANHLRDVHTPWNPGKLAQKIHRRQHERRERERQRSRKRPRPAKEEGNDNEKNESTLSEAFKPLVPWTPTEEDKKAWATKILEVMQKIENQRVGSPFTASETTMTRRESKQIETGTRSKEGSQKKSVSENKTGNLVIAYRDSLPPFLMAASNGDLTSLQELVEKAKEKDKIQNNHHLRTLLNTRDRHKSTADHWAAGGGHLDCLRYLYNLRSALRVPDDHNMEGRPQQNHQNMEGCSGKKNSKARRRDGKTCLHYAARNGQVHCIRYLLELLPAQENRQRLSMHTVDERSGEGTTPLHLACYGGHPGTVKQLVEDYAADPSATNDWGCTCAHWAAMTLSESEDDVRKLCSYLSETCGVSFTETQGQGHTALHKASHRRNRHVIRWMADSKMNGGAGLEKTDKEKAGAPDLGGHKPSDIWRNMGGDDAFAEWMKGVMGW